ncbi:MAG TPA: DPP IV N-terminal domain-containing protein [Gemmatimonadales bacterium]|jgi:dipeptidyl-peptidase-4
MIRLFRSLAVALVLAAGRLPGQGGVPRFASLDEAIRSGGMLVSQGMPTGLTWIDGGRRYSYTAPGANGSVIHVYDPATAHDSVLFDAAGLLLPGTTTPFSYQSFQWAADFKHLVFQTNFQRLYRRSGVSDVYVYGLADHSLQLAAKGARSSELSPDGSMLGVERGGDMYIEDLSSHHERRLTSDATELVYNGHFDWVYEEEFGQAQAWNWSPDSRHLAYWQIDESHEPVIQLSDYSGSHPSWDQIRIPQPGDSNPRARVAVLDARSGKRVWLDPGERGEYYIPRLYWTSRPDTLAMITLDRPQQSMKLWFFDVTTGGKRLVMSETSSTWIDVYDFYAGIQDMMSFPTGSHEFFWISDRDGWQHVYRYDYSGKLINQVTHGAWSVTRIEGSNAASQTMYYSSTAVSPLQRQLYAIQFDGSNPRRLTSTEGTHTINMSPDGGYYLDSWSSVRTPTQVELWATAGRKLAVLADNAAATTWVATHAYSPTQLMHFTTSDGVALDFSMLKPIPFDSTRKYPVIFTVYGGPGSQAVYDQFATSTTDQWLAQQGYIVVNVNNRGTNNYGSAFMKVVYKDLGHYESRDFAETARYLGTLPYVDAHRIGITGTSYGGYSTVFTMEQYPDLFTVGVANSAPADWRLYDTIYTERYMGLLGDNLAGYQASSAVAGASRLQGHLMLIHSMLDDNVHPQNTMQLLTAFTAAGKDVDLRIYPPGHHGAAYDYPSYRLVLQNTFDYLMNHLQPVAATP